MASPRRNRRDRRLHRLCRDHAGPKTSSRPPDGTIEIGWRLAPEFWGKGYVTEAAEALLRLRLRRRSTCDEIISFAVVDNHPLDRRHAAPRHAARPGCDFDHPGVPDTHPELKRHVLYRLSREDWRTRKDEPASTASRIVIALSSEHL